MRARLGASSLLLVCLAYAAVAQDTAPEARHVISSSEAAGSLSKKVNPVYPPLARQARIQGTVILKVVISKAGDVQSLQLSSGHPILAPAAIEAVKQWKYQPFVVNGEPVEVETTVQVNFTLAGAPPDDTPHGGVIGDFSSTTTPNPGATPSPRARISEGVMRALRIEKTEPDYPPLALQERLQGSVALQVQINEFGEVENIQLVSGHPMFAPPTIEAVKQWRYKPYLLNSNPIAVETIVRVDFRIAADQGSVEDTPLPKEPDTPVSASTPASSEGMAVPQRIRVSSGVIQGLLVRKVNPAYPPEARSQDVQGVVLLQVNIDTEGNIYKVQLISGHPLLAPAAIDAVKLWKYRPYLLNQTPVEVETQVQVNFVLSPP
jgi:TonB family protein